MSFNDQKIDADHYKDDVTYGEVRAIASEAIKAAEADPQGTELMMNFLTGSGPLVVNMIGNLAKTVDVLLDRLEAANEVAA